jgi:hypothetical protein
MVLKSLRTGSEPLDWKGAFKKKTEKSRFEL